MLFVLTVERTNKTMMMMMMLLVIAMSTRVHGKTIPDICKDEHAGNAIVMWRTWGVLTCGWWR